MKLRWIWQLPQNLLGLCVKTICKAEEWRPVSGGGGSGAGIYYTNGKLKGAVSLGDYIIIDEKYYGRVADNRYSVIVNVFGGAEKAEAVAGGLREAERTVLHELGHRVQSSELGWLYLIVIGLPSAVGNLIWRLPCVRHWGWDYYKQPWEAWANHIAHLN